MIEHENIAMWVCFALIFFALVLYAINEYSVEVVSVGILVIFIVYFYIFPVLGEGGENLLSPERFILGFSNPALVSVLALLVIGQGMVRTGVLDRVAQFVMALGKGESWFTILITLVVVLVISGFMNNIPVVVIFIPIMEVIAKYFEKSPSKVMMPLSFAAVLGGMTTLIGSGTNLLVSGTLEELGEQPFSFFQFAVPGAVLALVGLLFVFLVVPRLLPIRSSLADNYMEMDGNHFLAQITVGEGSLLEGLQSKKGIFGAYEDLTLRVIERDQKIYLPPFQDITLHAGDVLVVSATRIALQDAVAQDPYLLIPELNDGKVEQNLRWDKGDRVLTEVMIKPESKMVAQDLSTFGFRYKTHCVVLGIQRQANLMTGKITEIRLKEGDVLLVQGQPDDIKALRRSEEVIPLEWSTHELPALDHAKRAVLIFCAVIFCSATGILPVMVASMLGAVGMVVTGVISVENAARSIDSKIFTMIPAALAMGLAMQVTGGAEYLAHNLISLLEGFSLPVILSSFFLLVAVLSNIVSAKASAVLFTPIAIGISRELNVPVEAFAVAVIFASNCAIATPIGYQTSLMVMGPGHYTFSDFALAGIPLIIVLWVVFSFFAPWYYQLI